MDLGKNLEIRPLQEDEIVTAIREVISGCPDVPYYAEKNPERLAKKWTALMKANLGKSYGAIYDGKFVGLMLGLIVEDLLADASQGLECIWQVIPEYRSTGAGMKLMKLFEDDARSAGCRRIMFGASASENHDKMIRLYRKLGYRPAATTLEKLL